MDKEINTLKELLKNERHAFDSKFNKMEDQINELKTEVTCHSCCYIKYRCYTLPW